MLPRIALVFLLLAAVSGNGQNSKNSGRNSVPFEGAKLFQDHCAACHGADGRGHAAVNRGDAIPDLTRIAQKNHGVFPYLGVKNLIEGTRPITRGQSSARMPVWGPVFHYVDTDQDWGEVRLDAVTRHIESIQQK